MTETEKYILLGAGTVITYFLKDLHNRFKNVSLKDEINHDAIIVLQKDVKTLEDKQGAGVDQLKETFSIKFEVLTDKLESMEKIVAHTDNTMKTNGQLFKILLEELKKK